MKAICIDASNDHGTGRGLLTQGKTYTVEQACGGYYTVLCDNGQWVTKLKSRFTLVA